VAGRPGPPCRGFDGRGGRRHRRLGARPGGLPALGQRPTLGGSVVVQPARARGQAAPGGQAQQARAARRAQGLRQRLPAAPHDRVRPGILEHLAQLRGVGARADGHAAGQQRAHELEVGAPRGRLRQQGRHLGHAPAVGGRGEELRQQGLQPRHRVQHAHARRRQQVQRLVGRPARRARGRNQRQQRGQTAPLRRVQGRRRDTRCRTRRRTRRRTRLALARPRQGLPRVQAGCGLGHAAADHGQVASADRRPRVQRQHDGVLRRGRAGGVAQRLAGDGAARHVDARHQAGRHEQRIEGATPQPAPQAQLQPQPRRARRRERARAEGQAPGLPAFAHRVTGVQVVRRRRDAVARMLPADAPALGVEGSVRARRRGRQFRGRPQGLPGAGEGLEREGDLRHGQGLALPPGRPRQSQSPT